MEIPAVYKKKPAARVAREVYFRLYGGPREKRDQSASWPAMRIFRAMLFSEKWCKTPILARFFSHFRSKRLARR
jgi:hypothetical protein